MRLPRTARRQEGKYAASFSPVTCTQVPGKSSSRHSSGDCDTFGGCSKCEANVQFVSQLVNIARTGERCPPLPMHIPCFKHSLSATTQTAVSIDMLKGNKSSEQSLAGDITSRGTHLHRSSAEALILSIKASEAFAHAPGKGPVAIYGKGFRNIDILLRGEGL